MPEDKATLHTLFLVSIIIKGIDGVLELLAGITLVLIKSGSVAAIVQAVFSHELVQDPTDFLANYLIQGSQALTESTLSFAAAYLIIHGCIKVGLVAGLCSKRLWAYPSAAAVLSLLVIYQVIRLSSTHSIVLLFLTVVDLAIIVLIRFEYRRLKHSSR